MRVMLRCAQLSIDTLRHSSLIYSIFANYTAPLNYGHLDVTAISLDTDC